MKINDQIFLCIQKKSHLWHITTIAKTNTPGFVMHNFILCKGFQHHAKNQRNLMIQFQENPRDTAAQKGRQTQCQRIYPVTDGGLTSITSVEWHLKVKDLDYNIDLIKNYCIKVNMQKISSIHTLIHKIQQIFGSRELMAMPTQQSVKELLAFLNLQQHIKNQFIPSIHS